MNTHQTHRLCELRPGERAVICAVTAAEPMRRRLTDLGFTRGTCVRCVGRSPFTDPKAFEVRGAVIALRNKDSRTIETEGGVANEKERQRV